VELRRPLPPNRSLEQLKNHYLVEKSIAERLMAADRDQRKQIYATMYDELFQKVPDHPRLNRRSDDKLTSRSNRAKLALVKRFVDSSTVFMEYAPGDCRFVTEVAGHVKYAYGLDISDQRRPGERSPDNFQLVIYDGYVVEEIPSGSLDVIFSDQLIEHFHPADTKLHFALAHRLLKPNGLYVFRTPHAVTGPHDISKYFADEPECFHLKEWTFGEVRDLLKEVGFSRFRPFWYRRGVSVRLPTLYFTALERFFARFPKRYTRKAADYLLSQVSGVAVK
jgi:SAM-dependent methyltransferase